MLFNPMPVLNKEYMIKIKEGTTCQNIDSLIEDFRIIGEDIDQIAVKRGCIAVHTIDRKMRWENRAKLFNPDIKIISVCETTL